MEPDELPDAWPSFFGNLILFLICAYWASILLSTQPSSGYPPWVFLDAATLVFHEAGHIIFLLFGDFMHILGGSLTQLLVPIIAMVAFLRQSNWIGGGFSLFWLGESAVNLSFYIADARAQALPLLGGDSSIHDWNWLLTQTGQLAHDVAIGQGMWVVGAIAVAGGLSLMFYGMYRQVVGLVRQGQTTG